MYVLMWKSPHNTLPFMQCNAHLPTQTSTTPHETIIIHDRGGREATDPKRGTVFNQQSNMFGPRIYNVHVLYTYICTSEQFVIAEHSDIKIFRSNNQLVCTVSIKITQRQRTDIIPCHLKYNTQGIKGYINNDLSL